MGLARSRGPTRSSALRHWVAVFARRIFRFIWHSVSSKRFHSGTISHVIEKITGFHVCLCARAEQLLQGRLLIPQLPLPVPVADNMSSASLINSYFSA